MEEYQSILVETIAREVIPSLEIDSAKLVEMKCYQTILKIRHILEDESLDDPECFWKIEEIVSAMDQLGVGAGGRHDF